MSGVGCHKGNLSIVIINLSINIVFFIGVPAAYLCWVYVFFDIVFEDTILPDILGITIGHIYFYLIEIYPKLHYGKDIHLLRTP